jgi:hypothetical protein
VNKLDETPRAVAALLDFATVTIENAIAKVQIGLRWRFDQQNLVGLSLSHFQ